MHEHSLVIPIIIYTLFVTIVSYRVGWVGCESHLWSSCGARGSGGGAVGRKWLQGEVKWYGMI